MSLILNLFSVALM